MTHVQVAELRVIHLVYVAAALFATGRGGGDAWKQRREVGAVGIIVTDHVFEIEMNEPSIKTTFSLYIFFSGVYAFA